MQTFTATTGSRIPAAVALRGAANLPRRADPDSLGVRRTLARGDEVFAEGDPSTYFYKVLSGTVRTVKLLSDGRRQIDAFHMAGDIFGLESGAAHRYTGEAVDEVVVVAYRRSRFAELAKADPSLGDLLMASALASLDRAHDHMVVLGCKNAIEKLASFLVDLAERTACGDCVELPMQRTDIADHLGLTIETVSRTVTQMVRDGLIRLGRTGRTIILRDLPALQELGA